MFILLRPCAIGAGFGDRVPETENQRTQLLEESVIVRKTIVDLKALIKDAKITQYHTGEYLEASVFAEYERELAEQVERFGEISAQLSHLKETRQHEFSKHFIDICREEIDEEDFQWILKEAKKRAME